jgi:hypothetical protein
MGQYRNSLVENTLKFDREHCPRAVSTATEETRNTERTKPRKRLTVYEKCRDFVLFRDFDPSRFRDRLLLFARPTSDDAISAVIAPSFFPFRLSCFGDSW